MRTFCTLPLNTLALALCCTIANAQQNIAREDTSSILWRPTIGPRPINSVPRDTIQSYRVSRYDETHETNSDESTLHLFRSPVAGFSADIEDIKSLKDSYIKKTKYQSGVMNTNYSILSDLRTFRSPLEVRVDRFLDQKRNQVTLNGIKLAEAKDIARLKFQKIISFDKSFKTIDFLSINLQQINLSQLGEKSIKLCDGDAPLCGEARTTGWSDEGSTKRMVINITKNSRDGQVLLTQYGNDITGIANITGETFTIRHMGDDAYVLTSNSLSVDDRNKDDVGPSRTLMTAAQPNNPTITSEISIPFEKDTDCPNPKNKEIIDLVVAYTENARFQAKERGYDIISMLYSAEAISNTSFDQSDINGKVKIREILPVNYKEKESFSLDLDEFQKKEGDLKEVIDARSKNSADVVVLVVHNENPKQCGRAAEIGADADNAFVVVNWQCVTDRFSFIHEIAHLAGAWHDPKTIGTSAQISPAYAAGYITDGPYPVATIMAYIESCPKKCGRAIYWSNPFVKTLDGQILGTKAKNFDACVWRKRLPIMSKFGK